MPADSPIEPEAAIAIVGIAGLFPGSATLEEFWDNICRGVDSTSEVPAGRWLIDPAEAFDPRIGLADHVYSTRGGFVPPDGSIRAASSSTEFRLPSWTRCFISRSTSPERRGATRERTEWTAGGRA